MSADLLGRLRRLRELAGRHTNAWDEDYDKQAALGWEVLGLAEALYEDGHRPGERHRVESGTAWTERPCRLCAKLAALKQRMDELGIGVE